MNGSRYFKKDGYFEEDKVDVGTKVRIPTYTIFYINNIRQTQTEVGAEIIEYDEMKILGQINKITNSSESEIEEARNNDPESDFVLASVPDYDQTSGKLLGVKEILALLFVFGDPKDNFFDSGFDTEDRLLLSGYPRKKFGNPISCILPSLVRRLMKEGSLNTSRRSKIFC